MTKKEISFREKWGFEIPNQQDEIICYCKMGKRAMMAATILKSLGYEYFLLMLMTIKTFLF